MAKRLMLPPLQPQCASWSWAVRVSLFDDFYLKKMKNTKLSF